MADPIRELLSQTSYAADGATTVWNFSFAGGYIDRSHVFVQTLDPLTGQVLQRPITNADFIGDFQLQLTPPIAAGLELTIYRNTPKDVPLVNFADTAALTEAALDLNAQQAIFVAAESSDQLSTSIDGVSQIVDYVVTAQESAAASLASAGVAAVHEGNAATSASEALGYRNTASTHATNAGTSASAAAASAASVAGGPVASWDSLTGVITTAQVYTRVRAATLTGISLAVATLVNATDTVLSAIGKLQAQITSLLPGVAKTGDFKMRMAATADAGWIAGIGQTIGNTGSGATLTGADYLALFTLWWTDYTNAQLPILTSTGTASTRGASAAADWAAGKRLTVFDMRGRFARSAGTINGVDNINGTAQAFATGPHQHALNITTAAGTGKGQVNFTGGTGSNYGTDGAIQSGGASETRPDNIAMLGCFKL